MGALRRNIANTALTLGLSISIVGSYATTVNESDFSMEKHVYNLQNNKFQSNNTSYDYADNNVYIEKNKSNLEKEAQEAFGVMRDATEDELNSINNYIDSISINTGINFFSV